MSSLGLIAGVVALVWSYAVAWMTGVALFRRARRDRRARLDAAPPAGRWLLVRPCAGEEPELFASLVSLRRRADTLDLDVILGVSEVADPAFAVAERAAAELRDAGLPARVEVVPPTGPNRKASTLVGALEGHLSDDHAGAINIDSNIDLTGIDLAALVVPLSRASVGATWMPPVEKEGSTLGDRASRAVLGGSLHAFGLLASLDPSSLVGKVFAVRRDAIEACGLDELPSYLGEDVELSSRLARNGLEVVPVVAHARARPAGGRLTDTIARHARWITVVRAQRPALLLTYPLLFAPTPAIFALAATAALSSGWLAIAGALAALLARVIVSAGARYASGLRWDPITALADGTLADLVLWTALARSLWSREVVWRGRRLRIDRVGRLHAA